MYTVLVIAINHSDQNHHGNAIKPQFTNKNQDPQESVISTESHWWEVPAQGLALVPSDSGVFLLIPNHLQNMAVDGVRHEAWGLVSWFLDDCFLLNT